MSEQVQLADIMDTLKAMQVTMAGLATKEELATVRAQMATKEELAALRAEVATKEELAALRAETREELAALRERMATKEDLQALRAEVKEEIAGLREEITKQGVLFEAHRGETRFLAESISALVVKVDEVDGKVENLADRVTLLEVARRVRKGS